MDSTTLFAKGHIIAQEAQMPEAELDLSVFIPYLEKEESKAALKAYIDIMYGTPEDVKFRSQDD